MKTQALALASVLLLSAPLAQADTLLINRVSVEKGKSLPARGSSMSAVEAQFGAPQRRHAPVGGGSRSMPPISRWDYATFSVYFENSHVVDAVLNKSGPLEVGPRPVEN